MTRLLVFGASGGTGRQIVAQALAKNIAVTAFLRNPARLGVVHDHLRYVQGDVGDAGAVAGALPGHDAVVSALGVGTPLKHDQVVIDGVRNIVRAMEAARVRRLIYLSFIGVRDSRAAAGFLIRHVAKIPLRHEIADHEAKEALVRESALDWTIVRPPKLTDGQPTGRYRTGDDITARSIFPTLSRADVAAFMIQQVTDAAFVRKAARVLP
jgi:putative NADH-flavin reductase